MLYTASGVAASLLIVVSFVFYGNFSEGSEVLVSMSADYGNRSEIMLPDGSLVKLNAGSEVVYSYDPKKKTREVDFQGEGFFDVSKSKDPFVIKVAGGLNVRVGGLLSICRRMLMIRLSRLLWLGDVSNWRKETRS